MTQYNRPSTVPAWAESGATVQPTDAEIQVGWPATSVPPSRQRFNWILNWVANAVRYFLQLGVPEWAATESYIAGARVQYSGSTYKAIASSTNVVPGTDPAKWERWGFLDSELQLRIDKLLTKSVAGGADVTLSATEADNGIIVLTGAITANINVIVPNVARRWVVFNNTTGSFTLGVKTSSGSALTIAQGTGINVFGDGANNIRGTTSSGAFTQTQADALYVKQTDGIKQNIQSAAYTLVLSDAQKHILHPSADTTARTWTIPANASVAFPVGTAITFVNQASAGVITLAINTDTMRLAGSGATGSRTLAANGIATALKITATEWLISGTGLS